MEFEEIAPGIRAAFPEINGVHEVCSNAYLLDAVDGVLMIDAGSGALDLEKPERIILTHGHFDHTRGVKNGWKALMHAADMKMGSKLPFWKPPDCEELGMRPMKWGAFELEFIHTPGHTPGSVCIFERKSRILFSGDTLFQDGNCGRVDFKGGNAEQMKESLDKLADIDYSLLCPGHGNPEKRE